MLLLRKPEVVAKFLNSFASESDARSKLHDMLLTTAPEDIEFLPEVGSSNSSKVLKAYLASVGIIMENK